MTKAHSPLLGFNNNVKHNGRLFHIQTEDSGVKYPHVITHLFADGGRILKSTKTSYAEHLGSDDLVQRVRTLMKDQHKAMFIALRDGHFDALIEQVLSGAPSLPQPSAQSAKPAAATEPLPAESTPSKAPPVESAVQPARSRTSPEALAQAASAPPLSPQPEAATSSLKDCAELQKLDQAAEQLRARSPIFQEHDMPPPPAAVLGSNRPRGRYRALTPSNKPAMGKAPVPASGRYAASRPATIFASSPGSEAAPGSFGENLISGKTLDEVILSFLSEEFGSRRDDEGKK